MLKKDGHGLKGLLPGLHEGCVIDGEEYEHLFEYLKIQWKLSATDPDSELSK